MFFLAAAGVGLLLNPQRRVFRSQWAAVSIAVMIVIALPNVLWQVHNNWPTLEFLRNGQSGNKNVVLNPLQFFIADADQLGRLQGLNIFLAGRLSTEII